MKGWKRVIVCLTATAILTPPDASVLYDVCKALHSVFDTWDPHNPTRHKHFDRRQLNKQSAERRPLFTRQRATTRNVTPLSFHTLYLYVAILINHPLRNLAHL